MSAPQWVAYEDVIYIHQGVIEIAGGAQGLREASLLESALGRPPNQHAYGETDLFLLAAGYAEAISHNHPFVDGNKRTAFQTCYQFLKDNGWELARAKGSEHADMMVALAQGHMSREEVANYLRQRARPIG